MNNDGFAKPNDPHGGLGWHSSETPSGLSDRPPRRVKSMAKLSRNSSTRTQLKRRQLLQAGSGALAASAASAAVFSGAVAAPSALHASPGGFREGAYIVTRDGTRLYYKDWGPRGGQPLVFHHGWPLSSDDWDAQLLFFAARGYRVIAHDRRGHGRSSPTDQGADMDTYAADVAELVLALRIRSAVHIGHSTGGGEVARYVARSRPGQVVKAVLLSAVTPLMLKTVDNPGGVPEEVFDGMRAALSANRSELYLGLPSGPFYGFNRPGATVSQALIQHWWRQGMMGSAKAQYDGIAALSRTDFTEDLRAIDVPVLILHGEDDQIVPIDNSAYKSIELLKQGRLKTFAGLSHGLHATDPDAISRELLAFVRG